MANNKKPINVSIKNWERLSKLSETAGAKDSMDSVIDKLLEGITDDTYLIVLKNKESADKIKQSLGIFQDVFKKEFANDDEFTQAINDFFIENYKNYEHLEEETTD